MDYEEKYEQAMFRMNKWAEGSEITDPKEVAEFVFPELKESEEELMRKETISIIRQYSIICEREGDKCYTVDKVIAWLERQGEFKPIFRVGDYIRNKKTKDRVLIEQIDIANKVYCYVSREDAAEIHSDFRFSEQNDWEIIGQKIVGQKPTEWSEEDEKLLKLSLDNLTELKNRFGEKYGKVGDCILWLKSLKERMKGE